MSDDEERVARAMWSATHINPALPVPLPFDELREYDQQVLRAMARAAIACTTDLMAQSPRWKMTAPGSFTLPDEEIQETP